MKQDISGRCLCGASSYRTAAAPINVRVCHCKMCQRATGSAFYARVMVPLDQVDILGPVSWFQSSPALRRGFCGQCGCTMFSERKSGNVIGLSFGSLDDPDAFPPEEHIWTSQQQAWLHFDDGLPAYAEGPPV